MKKITIRDAKQDDLPAIAHIDEQVFSPHQYNIRTIRQFFDLFPEYLFVAIMDETICGYCLGGHSRDETWLFSLAVSPDYQSQGIGAALLRHGVNKFRNAGFKSVQLTVLTTNTKAIEVYHKTGFQDVCVMEDHFLDGKERLLMRCML